jgi:proline iminopeptidase
LRRDLPGAFQAGLSGRIIAMYPPIEPYDSGHLEVGDGHSVYWEVFGSPHGLPAVWLHGGPGAPATPASRRKFDPARYRAVIFDQRGCGRSRPLASDLDADLSANTTDHLVADIERLRLHLGIDRWVVVGGSWGVTLALVYAERHPDEVLGMVLVAVTSGRWKETQWITRDMGRVFPRQWDRFVELLPETERDGDLAAAYAHLLASPDQAVRDEAARRWCEWEDTHMSLTPGYKPSLGVAERSWQVVFARLVTHYWGHGCFLADNEVLANIAKIAHIPATLIHGIYDVSGPLDTPWELHKAWPASRLVVVEDAGHGGGSMSERFTAAIDAMADQLSSSGEAG